jgi:hypothetical protein
MSPNIDNAIVIYEGGIAVSVHQVKLAPVMAGIRDY